MPLDGDYQNILDYSIRCLPLRNLQVLKRGHERRPSSFSIETRTPVRKACVTSPNQLHDPPLLTMITAQSLILGVHLFLCRLFLALSRSSLDPTCRPSSHPSWPPRS